MPPLTPVHLFWLAPAFLLNTFLPRNWQHVHRDRIPLACYAGVQVYINQNKVDYYLLKLGTILIALQPDSKKQFHFPCDRVYRLTFLSNMWAINSSMFCNIFGIVNNIIAQCRISSCYLKVIFQCKENQKQQMSNLKVPTLGVYSTQTPLFK